MSSIPHQANTPLTTAPTTGAPTPLSAAPILDAWRRYPFTCAVCSAACDTFPSISMVGGTNSGFARCPGCGAALRLEIVDFPHGDRMVSRRHDYCPGRPAEERVAA